MASAATGLGGAQRHAKRPDSDSDPGHTGDAPARAVIAVQA